jgi:hypothetical protein
LVRHPAGRAIGGKTVFYGLNVHHPEIIRGILEQILATGDVVGRDEQGRIVLAVVVDDWLFDELAGFGADLADREPVAG